MRGADRSQAIWQNRLGSAFRTALACAIVGCATLYGPEPLRSKIPFPAFSYVTAILIVSDATLGDSMRGCWHVLLATAQVVPASILSLWLIGPKNVTEGVAATAVAVAAFLVAVPEWSQLMAKRIAFGQIVIVYVGAVVHGRETGDVMHPVHVAASTALGALASVLALLLPYPRLAYSEVNQLSRLYTENASERISLFVKAFCAQNTTIALETISQAKPLQQTGAKLLHSIKLLQEGVLWERPQIRPLKAHIRKPGDRLQDMEIPIRGMQMALTCCPSFPVSFIDQGLREVLLAMEVQIGLKLEQARCFPPIDATTAPIPPEAEIVNKLLQSIKTINPSTKTLAALFFLSCMKLLLDDESSSPRNPTQIIDKSNNEKSKNSLEAALCRFERIWPENETLLFALKCALSLGLAVFFGLVFNKENGYWSGLTIAISFARQTQATFTLANARAQGTAIGSVYGVLGCFFFSGFPELRILALLPWILFTSFLRHSRMYGEAGGVSGVIGALLILGRKNYGPPAEFAIVRLTEAFIGLFCFITIELLLHPTRAAALAKEQLSRSLGALRECISQVEISPDEKDMDSVLLTLREKQEKLKSHVNQLEKFAGQAELEPNFWFLPFQIACYNKLLTSMSKMVDLLLFMAVRVETLVEESQRCGVAWRELQQHINSDMDLFKKHVGSSLHFLEKITSIKSFLVFEREKVDIYNDLEFGKSSNADVYIVEAEKTVSSFLHHSKEVTDKFLAQEGEDRCKTEMALSLSAIGFCISGLMRETKEIEKGIKELVQWENPSNRMNFYEISHRMNALSPE